MADVAPGDIDLHFAWQAWHLETSTVTLRGRRGTYGTGLALVARMGLSCHTPSFTHNFVHTLSFTHNFHTLAQKHLIELLMWNASHVQKTLQLNLTGEIG